MSRENQSFAPIDAVVCTIGTPVFKYPSVVLQQLINQNIAAYESSIADTDLHS